MWDRYLDYWFCRLICVWNCCISYCSETWVKVFRNCERKIEIGGKNHPRRWKREHIQTDIWIEWRRGAFESLTVLFVNNIWSNCWSPFHFHSKGCLLQWQTHHFPFCKWRIGQNTLQGKFSMQIYNILFCIKTRINWLYIRLIYHICISFFSFSFISGCGSSKEDKESKPKPKCEQARTEVHRSSYWGWLWVLVYGILKVWKSLQESWEGHFYCQWSKAELWNSKWKCLKDLH